MNTNTNIMPLYYIKTKTVGYLKKEVGQFEMKT